MLETPKKILIITYYWPPAGGPGVQRWLKFVKYLPEFGWTPTVFIPQNPSYPIEDSTLSEDVDPELDIIRTRIWEPYQLAEIFGKDNKKFKAGQFDVGHHQNWKSRLSIWLRGNFFIPDARVFWVKPSVQHLRKYLKENPVDALVTTGPPHSLHLIGLQLKKEFQALKWIADFRDPWTEISYYQHLKLTKRADRKHRKLEEQVFKNADITLATSYTDAENFSRKGARAVCITNGFDQLSEPEPHTVYEKSEHFTLTYTGVLEQLRNPRVLWDVLNEIIAENADFAARFQLKFVGRTDDKIMEHIQQSALKKSVIEMGYLPHAEANAEMKKADMLLITNFPHVQSKGIIPGKIFEYLASGKTVISFGPAGSDVHRILEETRAGQHFTYDEHDRVKQFILDYFFRWKSGEKMLSPRNIERFSRRNLTQQLVELL